MLFLLRRVYRKKKVPLVDVILSEIVHKARRQPPAGLSI